MRRMRTGGYVMTEDKNIQYTFSSEHVMSGTEAVPEQKDEKRRLAWWQLCWGMLRYPARTFQATQGRAGLLLPAVMVLGSTILTALLLVFAQQGELPEMLYKEMAASGMSPAEIESVINMAASPWVIALGVAGSIAGSLFAWVVQSGIMHLAVRGFGGKGAFRQAFEVVGWAWIALFAGSLVKGGYTLLTGDLSVPQGGSLTQAFLTNTSLFNIWNMVLLVLGFAAVYGVQKWKAAVPVVVVWLATVLITLTGNVS